MAAEMEIDYQFSGVVDNDPLIVPLPKLHQKISTDTHEFGEVVNGRYYLYCHDRTGTAVIPTYNTKLTASCNPNGFEYVPVARVSSDDVPAIHVQITGIRADIQKVKRGIPTLRWLGLQDSKYVSLPTVWVETNFHQDLLAEAILRAENFLAGKQSLARFIPLPVGASRDDNPPVSIRDNQGFNFYYQGKMDNCVLGGLVNAAFWLLGPHESEALLRDFTPIIIQELWFKFVQHVNCVLRPGHVLKRVKTAEELLKIDDTFPLVAHLKSSDNSENHCICIFQGRIYDSASRFVLVKNTEALNWCCGSYAFARHLRIYRLVPREDKMDLTHKHGRKKKSRNRYR